MKGWALMLLLPLSIPVLAGSSNDYQCTIKRVVAPTEEAEEKIAIRIGRVFYVERKTGVMTGALLNKLLNHVEIIDPGSSKNAFKVMSIFKKLPQNPGSSINTLVINEPEQGEEKSFAYMSGTNIYIGTCLPR